MSFSLKLRQSQKLVLIFALAAIPLGCRDSLSSPVDFTTSRSTLRVPKVGYSVAQTERKIPDAYIVVFDASVTDPRGRAKALVELSGASLNAVYTKAIRGYSAHMSAQAAAAIALHPGVAFVEQDEKVSITESQSGAPWGLDRIDQPSLPLNGSYGYTNDGSGVNVYIIDTGIRSTHTQFGGRVVPAYTTIGDSFYTEGCHFHGTHVAGTVGGSSFGVAKRVTLHSIRVLDCTGSGSLSGVIQGIDWVTNNRQLPAVANMSLGGSYSLALNTAVENSVKSGITYVVAAGNSNADACASSPSSASAVISVGASNNADMRASFSNWGTCVDLFAPGVGVISAWNTDDSATGTASGTSMASPHVAGAAALYLQDHPNATPAEVSQALLANATSGVLSQLGSGSPDALLRVNGTGSAVPVSPPPSPAPPESNPVASFSASCPASKNSCTFDGSTSSSSAGIVSFSWNFGDGSSTASVANPKVNHSYIARGTYLATLTVTDGSGKESSATRKISVKNVAK